MTNQPKCPLPAVTEAFIHKLDAIRETMDVMMMMADASVNVAFEQQLTLLNLHGTLIEQSEKEKTYNVPLEHFRKLEKTRRRLAHAKTARDLLPRTFLVAFVSEFDAFLGNLLKALLELRPEILNGSDRQLSYKDLVGFESLKDAREFVVSREIESFMRESIAGQFKWLENRFAVKLREGLERWPTLIELTERRHLFVHSEARVSTQYLTVCKEHGVELTDIALGNELFANRDYLIAAYKCLYEIGAKLCQVLWRKLVPNSLVDADGYLVHTSFELLVDDRFDIATHLLEFYVGLPRHGSDVSRRIGVINLAQIHKWRDREEDCRKLLASEDWSACNDAFGLCRAVLEDRFDDAANWMTKIGKSGQVSELDYRDWPVFRLFRESEQFRETYKKVFGKEPIGRESIAVPPIDPINPPTASKDGELASSCDGSTTH